VTGIAVRKVGGLLEAALDSRKRKLNSRISSNKTLRHMGKLIDVSKTPRSSGVIENTFCVGKSFLSVLGTPKIL